MKRPNEFYSTYLEVMRLNSRLGAIERRMLSCKPHERPELETEQDAVRARITELSRWLDSYA